MENFCLYYENFCLRKKSLFISGFFSINSENLCLIYIMAKTEEFRWKSRIRVKYFVQLRGEYFCKLMFYYIYDENFAI